MRGVGEQGLGRTCLHWGGNSGFQAINLAFLWGIKRIVLLGFDMQMTGGKSHWFGNHPRGQGFANPQHFGGWIRHMQALARDLDDQGVDVFNATRETALTCFPRTTLETLP